MSSVIYRDRDLIVDKGIKNPWKFLWLETVLNDKWENDQQSKIVEMVLAAKVAKNQRPNTSEGFRKKIK